MGCSRWKVQAATPPVPPRPAAARSDSRSACCVLSDDEEAVIQHLCEERPDLPPLEASAAAAGARHDHLRPAMQVGQFPQFMGGAGNQPEIGILPGALLHRKAHDTLSKVMDMVSPLPEQLSEALRQVWETLLCLAGAPPPEDGGASGRHSAVGGNGDDGVAEVIPDIAGNFTHCF